MSLPVGNLHSSRSPSPEALHLLALRTNHYTRYVFFIRMGFVTFVGWYINYGTSPWTKSPSTVGERGERRRKYYNIERKRGIQSHENMNTRKKGIVAPTPSYLPNWAI